MGIPESLETGKKEKGEAHGLESLLNGQRDSLHLGWTF